MVKCLTQEHNLLVTYRIEHLVKNHVTNVLNFKPSGKKVEKDEKNDLLEIMSN